MLTSLRLGQTSLELDVNNPSGSCEVVANLLFWSSMSKKLIIDCCADCPHFDNEYYDYRATCEKLNKVNNEYSFKVLEDCPLEDEE